MPTYDTEIDLESYVRNYYVNRQVRAIFKWCISIQTIFEIFKYLRKKNCLWIRKKKLLIWMTEPFLRLYEIDQKNLLMDDRKIRCDTYMWTEIDLD